MDALWVIHSYLAAVAVGIVAAFSWIVRGIRADMDRLSAARGPARDTRVRRPAGPGRLDEAREAA